MSTKKVVRKLSSRSTMKEALVKGGLIQDKDIIVEEKVMGVKPKYGWDKAPKAERFVVVTNEVEKDIMENVPSSTPKDKKFRRLLKMAALLQIKLEGIEKRAKALIPRFKEDVINAMEVIRTFKLKLETEDKLASVLDAMGC